MLYLVESFLSIQGEGKYAGAPSVFFRFGGCNFTCKGFNVIKKSVDGETNIVGCDSLYAVDLSFKSRWESVHSSSKLLEILSSHEEILGYKPHIVITGGEPLINYKNKIFYDFISFALSLGYKITIETNASIEIDFKKYQNYKNLIFSMSVKLENSSESKQKRVNFCAIQQIYKNAGELFFKFVIDKNMLENGSAKTQIEEITKEYKNIPVYCMALGKNEEELKNNDESVINFCIENGYNYTDRIHIRVWNDRVGV